MPTDVSRAGQTASLGAESARLHFVVTKRVARHFASVFAVGGGVDSISIDPGHASRSVWTAGVDSRVDPVVEGMAGIQVWPWESLGVFVLGSWELDLAPHRYVMEERGSQQTFLGPSRVRMAPFVGIALHFGGADAAGEQRSAL
jgi:hypothetical protein